MRRPAASVGGLWCAPADPRGGRDRVRVTACVPTSTLSSRGVQLGHAGGVCVCGRRGSDAPDRGSRLARRVRVPDVPTRRPARPGIRSRRRCPFNWRRYYRYGHTKRQYRPAARRSKSDHGIRLLVWFYDCARDAIINLWGQYPAPTGAFGELFPAQRPAPRGRGPVDPLDRRGGKGILLIAVGDCLLHRTRVFPSHGLANQVRRTRLLDPLHRA